MTEFSRRVEAKRKQYDSQMGRSEISIVKTLEGNPGLGLATADLNTRNQCLIS